ncbi:tyrosine protein kinase Abl [Echinococcus multilocularis]|uniref:Tyrosine-protein kinase n=1 Tax=Echinococcus multilocularis TaxID=6211 RepID=I4ENX0_ECHMU|nr:Abl1 protein [Echinococcus multilocularis]CDS37968.1 tyrosine protein kinase Abl [Echinococcus multilocularis]
MGGSIGKPASSKEGSEKVDLSLSFNQQPDEISTGGECEKSAPVKKQILSVTQNFETSGLVEQCIMIVLYDFSATLDSQLTVKRGEIVRLLSYSPAGDWSEVEAPSHLPNRTPRVPWAGAGGWVRGWVPTSYLTEHVRPPRVGGIGSGTNGWRRVGDEEEAGAAAATMAYPWYHGAVSRQAAEQLLRSGITGSYLVRESESAPGQLSVTVRNLGRVYHYRISRDSCGWYFITETHRFPTVVQLIHHHSQAADGLICPLLYPAARREQPSVMRGAATNSGAVEGCADSKGGGGYVGFDDWEIDRSEIMMRNKLGWGQYGDVYEALWKRYNSIVAVKTLKQDVDLNLNDFLAEASIMKNLQHKNLVRFLGVCTREPPYYIVAEYMPHGNLLNYLRQRSPGELTPPILLYMAVQIASGMAYLEANNFIHRDLAARNCLVGDQYTIKVADFGLARYMQLHEDTYTARNGAKFPIKWTAPEGLAYFRFSSKSDVWAFGVVLWELATYGLSPYPGVELHGVYQLLEKGYRMQRPHGCPESVYSIMLRCWSWEAADRPTFLSIKAELEEMWRTIDMTEAVAQELATPPAAQTTDHMQFITATSTTATTTITTAVGVGPGINGGGEAMLSSVPVSMIVRMPSYQQDDDEAAEDPSSPSQSTTSCTSSSSAAVSSSSAAETDGQDGDDEGEEDLCLKSLVDKGALSSTANWITTRTSDSLYQGDYIVSGGGGGGGGVVRATPASDLPFATHKSTTCDSQVSAPASLPPLHHLQQFQHHRNRANNHSHHYHRHYQHQLQHSETGRSMPRRRSGPNHLAGQFEEGSLRCPMRPKEKNITPAESGVGESIVSADSPGGNSNAMQQEEGAVVMAPQRSNHKAAAVVAVAVEANNCCVTPTRDMISEVAPDERRMRLDVESVTQFTTLPAQDRITRYLESLGELGDASEERTPKAKGGAHPPHPPLLSHFPPPPPVPPPPQPAQHLRNSRMLPTEHRRNAVGRSASCYQTVSSVQLLLPPSTTTTNGSVETQESLPTTSTPSPAVGETITPTDDVYQAPTLAQDSSIGGNGGVKAAPTAEVSSEVEQAELTACLNTLSLEATELSTACPQLAAELSALSLQLSACRGKVEARLRASANGVGGTAEENLCLAGVAQALRHIQQALAEMRARVEEAQTPTPSLPAPSATAPAATNANATTVST